LGLDNARSRARSPGEKAPQGFRLNKKLVNSGSAAAQLITTSLRTFIDTPSDAEYTTKQSAVMETIFLACFAFGLLFTLASVALGTIGSHFGHLGHGHVGHGHVGHGHVGHDTHLGIRDGGLPILNASSAVGALTWFG